MNHFLRENIVKLGQAIIGIAFILSSIQNISSFNELVEGITSRFPSFALYLVVGGIIFKLLGGLFLAINQKVYLGLALLGIFTVANIMFIGLSNIKYTLIHLSTLGGLIAISGIEKD